MKPTLYRLCKELGLDPQHLREMYYKRIEREEAFRRKSVWDFLKEQGETTQDYFTMCHAIIDRDENDMVIAIQLGSPYPRDRIWAMQRQAERFFELGLFPDEEGWESRCEKCYDSGKYETGGKKRQCNCWKKPVKKWLLKYRNRLGAEKREAVMLASMPNSLYSDLGKCPQ